MEKPLIATFWSGPTEFMTEENSYPLHIEDELVEIKEGIIIIIIFFSNSNFQGAFEGHKWAEPKVEHLKELMRSVFSNPDEAKRVIIFEHFKSLLMFTRN